MIMMKRSKSGVLPGSLVVCDGDTQLCTIFCLYYADRSHSHTVIGYYIANWITMWMPYGVLAQNHYNLDQVE